MCLAESVLSSDFVPENAKFPVEASVAYHLLARVIHSDTPAKKLGLHFGCDSNDKFLKHLGLSLFFLTYFKGT